MEDDNIKKAKETTELFRLQQKAQEYQNKVKELMNKEYQAKYSGLSIKMKGDYTVLDVSLDQSFYETSSKSVLEQAIVTAFRNIHQAIEDDQEALKNRLQTELNDIKYDGNH